MLYSDASETSFRLELNELRRRLDALATARTAQATSVSEGTFRVHSGASILLEGGGDLIVGSGCRIQSLYAGGLAAAVLGQVHQAGDPDVPHGTGLYLYKDGTGEAIWWATHASDGHTEMVTGSSASPIDKFWVRAVDSRMDVSTFDVQSGNGIDMDAGTFVLIQGNTIMQLLCEGQAALGGTTGTYLQPESTGLAANMYMAVDGRVYRSTSSRRYKRDIQDHVVDPDAVLQLRPRTWLPGAIPKICPAWVHAHHAEGEPCPAEQDPEPPDPGARRQVGFVAEELDELGLGDFVEYDDQDRPDAIAYDRLTAALVPLVQRQQAQIDALTAQVQALADRVAALEPDMTTKSKEA